MIFSTGHAVMLSYFAVNSLINLRRFRTLSELSDPMGSYGQKASLSICIPCRNDGAKLRVLLSQIQSQSLRPQEVLVLNDQSTDETAQVLEEFQKTISFLKILQGSETPQLWRGKVWALEQLLREAQSDYVLFLDADVRLDHPFALAKLWQHRQKGLVSVFPRSAAPAGARFLVEGVYTQLLYLIPFFAEKLTPASAAVACGQVYMAPRELLCQLKVFGRIKDSTHDGLRLARLLKKSGVSVQAFEGASDFSCLYYSGFFEAFRGFSRNAFEGQGKSYLNTTLSMSIFFWVFVVPFVLWPVFLMNPFWLLSFFFLIFSQVAIASRFGFPVSQLPWLPVKAMAQIAIYARSSLVDTFQVPQHWKGRLLK